MLEAGARDHIAGFVRAQLTADGGFRGRAAQSDLYYTVFGIEVLSALDAVLPHDALLRYLEGWGAGADLDDLVHVACLARCRARVGGPLPSRWAETVAAKLESFRTADGAYGTHRGGPGSVYAGFLAETAYAELGLALPDGRALTGWLARVRLASGAYADGATAAAGTTPTTAAAVVLLSCYETQPARDTIDWLLARHDTVHGGFRATPDAPEPDLLSTATALFALATLAVPLAPVRAACTEFVQLLWDETGGFGGNVLDLTPDCEYTFYALLALGCMEEAIR